MKGFVKIFTIVMILSITLVSCSFPLGQQQPADENAINTSVAQTLVALGGAAATPEAIPTITSMPLPTAALPTVEPTAIPPTAAPTQDTCNRAKQ